MWAAATVKETGKQPDELLAEASRQLGEAARELEKVGAAQGLSSTEKEVREAYEVLGWRVVQREQDKWVMVVLRQPEDGTGSGLPDLPLSP